MEDSSFAYWEAVTNKRAQEVSEDDWLEGKTLSSVESSHEAIATLEGMMQMLVKNEFASFLHYLKFLTPFDHDLMVMYHVLGHRQEDIGKLMGKTQTGISSLTRAALRKLAFYMMCKGQPSEAKIMELVTSASLDPSLPTIIEMYRQHGNFLPIAMHLKSKSSSLWHTARVRKVILHSAEAIQDSPDPELQAFSAYLYDMIDEKDRFGRRKEKTMVERKDPPSLGKWRASLQHDDWECLFPSDGITADEGSLHSQG